ncbi:MAG TPA: hypothetical protein VFH22_01850 [Rhodocyclaceae bacterium]|nr:hypothetical protein [Rhodocyclaceae bacterium]
MIASLTDPRTDAPNAEQFLLVPVRPLVAPAVDRILADLRRRNPMASEVQLVEQLFFEVVILMDARLPCGTAPYAPRVGSNPDEDA